MAKYGKKYLEVAQKVDSSKRYTLAEACELVKATCTTKFDSSIELALNMNLDQRKAEQNLRGAIVLPAGTGKTRKVLVLTKNPALAKEATEAGADFVGESEFIAKIQGGWFGFDIIVATPDMMGELGKIGKLLGPKGLMPNAKTGTVTMAVAKAVNEIKLGKVEYRVDKQGNIQTLVGKASFTAEQLAENIKAILSVIVKAKPSTVKGAYIKGISISSTMGPGIKLAIDQFL